MTRTRYKIYDNAQPHFLTCTVVGWAPVFTNPDTVAIVLDSLRFLQDAQRIAVFGYVVLENHIHLIASAANLSEQIGDFKSFTARKIIDNPVARGYVDEPTHWRYSSARNYAGMPSLIPVVTDWQ